MRRDEKETVPKTRPMTISWPQICKAPQNPKSDDTCSEKETRLQNKNIVLFSLLKKMRRDLNENIVSFSLVTRMRRDSNENLVSVSLVTRMRRDFKTRISSRLGLWREWDKTLKQESRIFWHCEENDMRRDSNENLVSFSLATRMTRVSNQRISSRLILWREQDETSKRESRLV